jgi:hypothetical protein
VTYKRLAGAVAVLALAGTGLLLGGSPAQAQEMVRQPVQIDRTYAPCGPVKISTEVEAFIVASANGQTAVSESLGASVEVGPFDAPTVVQWRLFGGGERDLDYPLWVGHPATDGGLTNDAFKVAINAYGAEVGGFEWTVFGPEQLDGNPFIGEGQWKAFRVAGCVTPEEPSVAQFECATGTDAGELVIPTQDGVVYDATSGPVPPGTYPVTASPAPGYAFPGDATTQWELVVNPVNGCPGEPGDPGEPGAPGGGGSADGSESLPVTGSPVQTAAAVGGGLVALGTAAVVLPMWWQRRRRNALLGGLAE